MAVPIDAQHAQGCAYRSRERSIRKTSITSLTVTPECEKTAEAHNPNTRPRVTNASPFDFSANERTKPATMQRAESSRSATLIQRRCLKSNRVAISPHTSQSQTASLLPLTYPRGAAGLVIQRVSRRATQWVGAYCRTRELSIRGSIQADGERHERASIREHR
jgi:hypothetical protein